MNDITIVVAYNSLCHFSICLDGSDFNNVVFPRLCIPPLMQVNRRFPLDPITFVFDDEEFENTEGFILNIFLERDDSDPQPVSVNQGIILVRIVDDEGKWLI